jgi:hypothetical protein
MADRTGLQAVAETHAFSEDIDAMLSEAEQDAVITGIALAPRRRRLDSSRRERGRGRDNEEEQV